MIQELFKSDFGINGSFGAFQLFWNSIINTTEKHPKEHQLDAFPAQKNKGKVPANTLPNKPKSWLCFPKQNTFRFEHMQLIQHRQVFVNI